MSAERPLHEAGKLPAMTMRRNEPSLVAPLEEAAVPPLLRRCFRQALFPRQASSARAAAAEAPQPLRP
jgi:hypothetical protein